MGEDTLEIRWRREQANMEAFEQLKTLLVDRGQINQTEADAMPYFGTDQVDYAQWYQQLQDHQDA